MKDSLVSGTFDLFEIFINDLTILTQHELFGNDTFQKVLKTYFLIFTISLLIYIITHIILINNRFVTFKRVMLNM